jgi:hypothetical protein
MPHIRKPNYPSVRVSITEDIERTWDPNKYTTDDQMNFVLECLLEGPMRQAELGKMLAFEFGMNLSTARAAASAACLLFRQSGWIQEKGKSEGSTIWEVVT